MSKRLEILKNSLAKKEALAEEKLRQHFASVKQANGQPLNDKRDGYATLRKWGKQEDSIRNLMQSIEKTKLAIEIEEDKIYKVKNADIPEFLKPLIESGELIQWRKYPNRFFVPGVPKARIIWDNKKKQFSISHLFMVQDELLKDKFLSMFEKVKGLQVV